MPEGAVHKLKELIRNDSRVKCIAFTSTGGWVILFDDNGFLAKGIPDEAFAKLKELADNGSVLRWIAFTPADGFVILADKSGFFARGHPAGGRAPPQGRQRQRRGTQEYDVRRQKWLGADLGRRLRVRGPAQRLVPPDAEAEPRPANLKSVAFTPAGGWALLVNRDGAYDSNIPDAAFAKIDELQKLGGAHFNCIAFPPNADNAWVLSVD